MAETVNCSPQRPRLWVAAVAALALLLSSCSAAQPTGVSLGGEIDPLMRFHTQQVTWEDCEGGLSCAEVLVPLDYEDPTGETLMIALAAPEPEEGRPHLLTNPGGPGSSGVDLVGAQRGEMFTPELQEAYTLVGFDPRGVHRSHPVQCLEDGEMDAYREEQAFEPAEVAELCEERSGELLGHVDTVSAARDMDIIRAALGEEQLHYLGFSYGTRLGMTYAELFPEATGRFVLDAMVDVSLSSGELLAGQAAGFEEAVTAFAQWCVTESAAECPVQGEPEDMLDAIEAMFDDVIASPRQQGSRTVSASLVLSGFIAPLYVPGAWPLLRDGLSMALEEDDYTAFLMWNDQSEGRSPDGSYEWMSAWAFNAVMCLDYPALEDAAEIEAEVEEVIAEAPMMGQYFSHQDELCREWPYEAVNEPWEPGELPEGAVDDAGELPEMLLIGTTGDPATPVEWAEDMHQMAPNSALLIFEGEGHAAYRPGHDCVVERAEEYLIDGVLFADRETC